MLCYAKSLQSCPTLCDPTDGSPPGSPVPGILQAKTLEWVAISFSNACKWKEKMKSLSCVRLLATPWTAAHQAPLSMGFSRQEYWSGVPLLSPLLVCQGCHNKTPQTGRWTAEIYFLVIMETRYLMATGVVPSEASPLSEGWSADGCLFAVYSHGLSSVHSYVWCLFVCQNFFFLEGYRSDWIRAHPHRLILTSSSLFLI